MENWRFQSFKKWNRQGSINDLKLRNRHTGRYFWHFVSVIGANSWQWTILLQRNIGHISPSFTIFLLLRTAYKIQKKREEIVACWFFTYYAVWKLLSAKLAHIYCLFGRITLDSRFCNSQLNVSKQFLDVPLHTKVWYLENNAGALHCFYDIYWGLSLGFVISAVTFAPS